MFKAFDALYGEESKTLILGTFPSVKSREKGGYYANPQNHFWSIITNVFNENIDMNSYEEKKKVLFKHGIALWDTLKSCEINGSLDKNIRNETANKEIPEFIKRFGITKVLFNGNKAYCFYRRYIGIGSLASLDYCIMPSTSPANAKMSFERKLAIWKEKLL
jgi:hypoxanthine-DNA glycosylase